MKNAAARVRGEAQKNLKVIKTEEENDHDRAAG